MLYKNPSVKVFTQSPPLETATPNYLPADILNAIEVNQVDTGLYTSRELWKPFGARGVFGGQVVAQALRAAANTVNPSFYVHSLHCYFIRAGDNDLPILFKVDHLRSGRSYATRVVKATQRGKAIFTASVSFSLDEPGPVLHHQPQMPSVMPPESLPTHAEVVSKLLENNNLSQEERDRLMLRVEETAALDSRVVPSQGKQDRQYTWLRTQGRLNDDDRTIHACIAAYASDRGFISIAAKAHGMYGRDFGLMVSLDHQIWFHAPFRTDEWLLYETTSPTTNNGRGLCMGQLYTRDGRLVATTMQEGALRLKRQTKM
ncbi:HotDog domain-containing protein [Umbelopsis sp. PMI_123]|nr:HotDog domain-containing protein [Umbelopsis sp. PMI_123]